MFLQSEIRRAVATPGTPHNPSRPGQPPHKVSGDYQRELFARVENGAIVVGSTNPAKFRRWNSARPGWPRGRRCIPRSSVTRSKVLDIIRGR